MKKQHIILISIIAVVLAVMAVSVIAGSRGGDGYEYVSVLRRPQKGDGDIEYELEVLYENRWENVTVNIGQRMITDEELDELFDMAAAELEREFLGNNRSRDFITDDVVLISELKKFKMKVEWFIEDRKSVDYWGCIYPEDYEKEVVIIASLSYYGEAGLSAVTCRDYEYKLLIQPKTDTVICADELRDMIYSADSRCGYMDEVMLPQEYKGNKVIYRQKTEKNYIGYIVIPILLPLVLLIGCRSREQEKKKKRETSFLVEYPEIITKLSLLIGAGMTPYNAIERIATDKKGEAYKELHKAVRQIQSGSSPREVYADFGRRFGLHCYSKLGTYLEQNVIRGNERLREMLRCEAAEALEERKARAKKAGEQAGTKLLIPMMLMLAVVLVIIMVPAFMSF